jgi:hypothetical protein
MPVWTALFISVKLLTSKVKISPLGGQENYPTYSVVCLQQIAMFYGLKGGRDKEN